jgi:hypothetical protein
VNTAAVLNRVVQLTGNAKDEKVPSQEIKACASSELGPASLEPMLVTIAITNVGMNTAEGVVNNSKSQDIADGVSPPQGFQALPAPDTCPTTGAAVSASPVVELAAQESMSLGFDASTKLSGTLKENDDGVCPPQGFLVLPAPNTWPTSVAVAINAVDESHCQRIQKLYADQVSSTANLENFFNSELEKCLNRMLEDLQDLTRGKGEKNRDGRQDESGEGSALIAKTNNHNPAGQTGQAGESGQISVRFTRQQRSVQRLHTQPQRRDSLRSSARLERRTPQGVTHRANIS